MTTKSYPVPKPLWDALENILMVKSKELMKDIAKTLKQPEKPLLDAFKAKKHTFHLIDVEDPTDDRFECDALLCQSAVAHKCRKAVLFGKTRCPEHEFWKNPIVERKPIVQRVNTEENESYFVDTLGNVYSADYQRVGQYAENILTLFEIDEEEEYV